MKLFLEENEFFIKKYYKENIILLTPSLINFNN
jgi:hypothetical protein